MPANFSRRYFFFGSLLAGALPAAGQGTVPSLKSLGYKSPNEKLNLAAIGAGGKGRSDIAGCATENIVALCDVDDKSAGPTYERYPNAAKYKDFRKMLDKEAKNIDAVTVSIPDHMHGTAAMWAMERGKHVYVQKPLTRTIWEARELANAAAKFKVASQMGNQGYSNEGTRQCAEMIWNGDIGDVTEVHAWTNRPIWPQGLTDLPKETSVPETLDWDQWLGIAAMRAYGVQKDGKTGAYAPFAWRGWYDFGCGALGDMACHILGAPNMALMLGAPTSVECLMQEGKSPIMYPEKSIIRFDFPARGSMPAVKIFWYDGIKDGPPRPNGVDAKEFIGDLPRPRAAGGRGGGGRAGGRGPGGPGGSNEPAPPPRFGGMGQPVGQVFDWEQYAQAITDAPETGNRATQSGVIFVGSKGFITAGEYGAGARLLPAEKMKDYRFPPPVLTRSPGGGNSHYRDWLRACKGGDHACSNFSQAGPFTEWILLGVISLRFEGKLEWDSAKMRVTNNADANKFIKPVFRKGWSFT
jgi:predicted dehydrogenase